MIVPLIPTLLFLRYPSAIAWLIVSVCVYPINGMTFRGGVSHVRQESGEGLAPPATHRDSPSAVQGELVVVLKIAPIQHVSPLAIQSSLRQAMRRIFPVLRFSGKASATSRATANDVAHMNALDCTAIAQHRAFSLAIYHAVIAGYGQSPESLANNFKWFHGSHNTIPCTACHPVTYGIDPEKRGWTSDVAATENLR